MNSQTLISVILPIYNGSSWIDQCFDGILRQQLSSNIIIEVCVCNDASTDDTLLLLEKWKHVLQKRNISLKIYNNDSQNSKGVGYSKNKAVSISSGVYLCFQDVVNLNQDDIMLPNRIREQYEHAKKLPQNTIIGSQFKRVPENSTQRYTEWANSLSNEQLYLQIYTSHGPTIIMPTWFCHRSVFESVGGFSEAGYGIPEDLMFFYSHLDRGGKLHRVDQCLLLYTYHPNATTFSVQESTIWNVRLKRLENVILNMWSKFTIWNAGKQGRKLYNSLSKENQDKVIALCDVDRNKIGKKYVPFDPITRQSGREVEIVYFKDATPPFVICVKLNLTNGEFENNLKTLQLKEGIDYILFS